MDVYFGALGTVVAASLFVGGWQALRARTRAEAMLSVQIAGTAAAATLLLVGPATVGMSASLDLAIVVAALAAVPAIAFVAFGWEPAKPPGEPGDESSRDRA